MTTKRPSTTTPAAPAVTTGAVTHRLFIDSVADGVARLSAPTPASGGADLAPGLSFPAALLPAGVGEGAWIEVQIHATTPPAGQDNAAARQRLGQGDDGGDLKL